MKLKNLWLIIGAVFVVLVIVVSLVPEPPSVANFQGSDKFEHFGAYAFLTLWFCQIYGKNSVRLAIGVTFILLGVALEYLQGYSGYRFFGRMMITTDGLCLWPEMCMCDKFYFLISFAIRGPGFPFSLCCEKLAS